jgi:hypothetical protein
MAELAMAELAHTVVLFQPLAYADLSLFYNGGGATQLNCEDI